MKKVIVCLCAILTITLSISSISASADGSNPGTSDEKKVENYISGLYRQVDFGKHPLAFEVFEKAYRGFINLRNAGKLNTDHDVISICDFSLPSSEKRLWIINLNTKKVLFNTYVAHGQGSGNDGALSFSNQESSHKSSLGFYVTGDTYEGDHGTSLRLNGMDQGFNDAALDRGIVVHGADYVCENFINRQDRLGRSWGCPAVPSNLSLPIINAIKEGTCLYIYYPDHKYMKTAYWLNKKVEYLPETSPYENVLAAAQPAKPTVRVIQYIHNGVVDSVKTMPLSVK
jgi:L,D-transpeptidase catalytic domain